MVINFPYCLFMHRDFKTPADSFTLLMEGWLLADSSPTSQNAFNIKPENSCKESKRQNDFMWPTKALMT